MLTNFHENWKGAGIFCVELTWNDPATTPCIKLIHGISIIILEK